LEGTSVNASIIRLRSGTGDDTVMNDVREDLSSRNEHLHVELQSARELVRILTEQKTVHAQLMASIGGLSLLVGGIGIMNVMLMGVVERRREIGIRMAVGARPRDVWRMFLIEAITLAILGGILGVVAGVFASFIVAQISHWTFSLAYYSLPLGTVVAASIGVIFGVFPAVQASRLNPIDALRDE